MPSPSSTPSAVAVRDDPKVGAIVAEWDRQAESMARILPDSLDVARFRELVFRELTKSPQLLQCTPRSVLRAASDMGKLGLEPVLGEAYLVPFWNRDADRITGQGKGAYEATLIIGYHGLQTLAFNSGFVTLIEGEVVREHDEFDYVRGYPESVLRHVPAKGDRGDIVGGWAMVWLRNSERPLIGYLPIDRIEQRRLVSKSGTDPNTHEAKGVWREWREEMVLKTVLRFTLNLSPKAVRARVAVALGVEDAVDAMLALETKASSAPKSVSPRKRRMLARLSGAPEAPDEVEGESKDAPEGDEPAGSPETGGNPETAQDGADPGTTSGQPDADAGAAESAAPETAGLCGAVHPEEPTVTCGLAAGHLEQPRAPQMHRKLDATGKALMSWPAQP